MTALQIIEALKALVAGAEEAKDIYEDLKSLIAKHEADLAAPKGEDIKVMMHPSDQYTKIDLGIDYVGTLVKAFHAIYPGLTMTKPFPLRDAEGKEDTNLAAQACKLTADQEQGEVFFIWKKVGPADTDVEYYFFNKYLEEIMAYIEQNPEVPAVVETPEEVAVVTEQS